MASIFFGLNIATSGMQAYQTSLNTTAHNLSNIGTDGYSKQEVKLSASEPISITGSYGMIGSGVQIADIYQERNQYYDSKYRYNESISGEYSTKEYYLDCIQGYIYSEDAKVGGITTSFNDFFSSLTSLTSEASDMTKRTDSAILSESFTQYVGEFAKSLQTLQDESNTQIETVISQINALGEEIASVTQKINTYEISGETANDLRDTRNALLDKLSVYADITAQETAAQEGSGNTQFVVYIDGAMLVDSTKNYSLKCVASGLKDNQNDIEGLYEIKWENGQNFNMRSSTLGGTLQALLAVRDGNNDKNFSGKASSTETTNGVTKFTVTDTNSNDLLNLNIPENNGRITISNTDYEYSSFDVKVNDDGTYTYEFTLKGNISDAVQASLDVACNNTAKVKIGEKLAYKGIPYYMAQLNEFTRTFASEFNKVHNKGFDLNGNAGVDWFNIEDKLTGENYVFDESIGDPTSTNKQFSSVISKDANGVFSNASYYSMTALNFGVNKELLDKPSMIACMSTQNGGVENNENLAKLTQLKSDNDMFNQGTPDAFLQTLISAVGIDCKQAKSLTESQSKILLAIDARRQSVSGVDKDEEAADLSKFQNLLFSQYKVLSVMNEVLNKLINGTAV